MAKKNTQNHSHPSFGQTLRRIMYILGSILLAFILIIVTVLEIWSIPGKPKPYLGADGEPLLDSISEKVFVEINGVKQGMFIKGKDINNPVLLYLHGGMPDYFLTEQYPTGLEDQFTVVWWEQRGSGLSYSSSIPPESMNLEQMISDTIELTKYLCQRFHKDKIYLMAHSGGSFIGIQAAARAPDLYHAYIAVAQIAYQLESEKLAYDYMLEEYKAEGNTKMVQKLQAAPVTMEGGVPDSYRALRDFAMHPLGIGTMHSMKSVVTGIILPSFRSPEYTLGEKFHTWTAKAKSGIAMLWGDMVSTDLRQTVTKLDIPVYFLEGIYDYTCNYSLAKDYFGKIEAPVKGFYTFSNSAHSPIFEEPLKVQEILREDVLQGKTSLSDR